MNKLLVGIITYGASHLERTLAWFHAWKFIEHQEAEIFLVHNLDRIDASLMHKLSSKPDYYIPRENFGYDIGAFQDVINGVYDDILPKWDRLLWACSDSIPMKRDFLLTMLNYIDNGAGLVGTRLVDRDVVPHLRTNCFLITKELAKKIQFPKDFMCTKSDCYTFEHREFNFYQQVLRLGYEVKIADPGDLIWDRDHDPVPDRWLEFHKEFPN